MASARTTVPPIPRTFISTASPTSSRCFALAGKKRAPNCRLGRMLIRHRWAAATSANQRLSQARSESSANVQTLPLRHTLAFRPSPCQTRRVVIGLFPELDAPYGVQSRQGTIHGDGNPGSAAQSKTCPGRASEPGDRGADNALGGAKIEDHHLHARD